MWGSHLTNCNEIGCFISHYNMRITLLSYNNYIKSNPSYDRLQHRYYAIIGRRFGARDASITLKTAISTTSKWGSDKQMSGGMWHDITPYGCNLQPKPGTSCVNSESCRMLLSNDIKYWDNSGNSWRCIWMCYIGLNFPCWSQIPLYVRRVENGTNMDISNH